MVGTVKNNHFLWIDSCRFIAILIVMVVHFLAEFFPSVLIYWEVGPSSWLLYGLTGKFSVIFFFVLLGYFSSRVSVYGLKPFLQYGLKRYFQFAFYVFVSTLSFILICYCIGFSGKQNDLAVQVCSTGVRTNLLMLLENTFLLKPNYNSTLWCMPPLLFASILCRALGYLPQKSSILLRYLLVFSLMFVFIKLDEFFFIWVCAAMLGYLLRITLEQPKLASFLSGKAVLSVIAVVTVILMNIRIPEGTLKYTFYSLASASLILIQFNLPMAQRILSTAPLPWLGSISMGIFIVHTPIRNLLKPFVHKLLLSQLPTWLIVFYSFAVSLILSIFCAWILHRLFNVLDRRLKKISALA